MVHIDVFLLAQRWLLHPNNLIKFINKNIRISFWFHLQFTCMLWTRLCKIVLLSPSPPSLSYLCMYSLWTTLFTKELDLMALSVLTYVEVPRKQLKSPQEFHLPVFGWKWIFVFHLAFISYEKLFECTAMRLATWKPDFTGGCKQRVNCYQIARHVSPNTIQTSPNIRFLRGFIFEKYLSITFLDVVVQNRYIYTLLVNIF